MKDIKVQTIKQKHRIGFLSLLIFVAGATSVLSIQGQTQAQTQEQTQAPASSSLPLEDLQLFSEVFGRIKSEYVDEVDDTTLLRDAIQGMLAGLDPHSTFLEPEDFEQIKITTEGKFGGLGIKVTTEDGLIKVVTPIDGTPAFDAGVKPGDLILMIDDVSVHGLSLKDAVDKMRGDPGSKIKLTIFRESVNDRLDIKLVRAIIKINSVRGEILEDGFGYVRLSSFQSGTVQSLRSKIKQLNELSEGGLKGLVLDLRNNPGGVLMGAVQVSDMFIVQGEIVSTRGRTTTSGQSFLARPDDVIDDAPMVVLVNGGSASASEIVAGALQDHQRAIIMGTKTFGKGSVQTVVPMNNGGALKLTTARYYTPSNRSIQAKGIVPDITVEQADFSADDTRDGGCKATQDAKADDDTIHDTEKQISESDLAGHLENGEFEDNPADEEKIQLSERTKKDHQLGEALNMLKGMSLVKRRTQAIGG
ncbi:S41 family peptidase [Candidatus Spongiihabitans sp.]|uniref:S41 family peptidase n=1 Tax=Candidatus Spongiihabitans sp. TaxID=3101308 RepID=UPI003C6FECD3